MNFVHRVLWDYCQSASPEVSSMAAIITATHSISAALPLPFCVFVIRQSLVEVITQVRDAALAMVSSPEGAKVLCLCLGMGTAKVPTTQLPRLPLLHPSHGPSNPFPSQSIRTAKPC